MAKGIYFLVTSPNSEPLTSSMKNLLFGFFILICVSLSPSQTTNAQSIELLAGNTLNGAMNGTILGGAAMAITDDTGFHYLRVGLGLGTLYGIGMGAFDIVYGGGSEILVSGLFNDGTNSSIIILLDTFYGAAAGAIVTTAVMLVSNDPLLDGLQYGAGFGAVAGFGFGVFDSFFIAKRSKAPVAFLPQQSKTAGGILAVNFENGASLGFVNPSLVQTLDVSRNSLRASLNPSVDLLNFRINF